MKYDFKQMTDKELMYWYYLAKEYQDKRYYKEINKELCRRWRDE